MQGQVVQLAKGVAYQPKASVEDGKLPDHFANYPFVFVHYHAGWSFDIEHGFLPELSEIQQRPGVNGVGDDLKMVKAVAGSMGKGGVVIPTDAPNLGPWTNYITRYECKGGKYHYCFKSCSYFLLPNGGASPRDTHEDFAAFQGAKRAPPFLGQPANQGRLAIPG